MVCSENKIIALHRKRVVVIDNANFTVDRTIECHSTTISCARVDGNVIVTGSWDRTLSVIDLPTGEITASIKAHTANIKDVALTPEFIISCSNDRHIKFFDRRSHSLVHDLQLAISGRSCGICALALNTQINRFAIGLRSGLMVLCDFSMALHSKLLELKHSEKGRTVNSKEIPNSLRMSEEFNHAPIVLEAANDLSAYSSIEALVQKLQMDEHKLLSLHKSYCRIWDVRNGRMCYESKAPPLHSYVDALFDDTRLFLGSHKSLSIVSFV
jgi:WD40 repeat protein